MREERKTPLCPDPERFENKEGFQKGSTRGKIEEKPIPS